MANLQLNLQDQQEVTNWLIHIERMMSSVGENYDYGPILRTIIHKYAYDKAIEETTHLLTTVERVQGVYRNAIDTFDYELIDLKSVGLYTDNQIKNWVLYQWDIDRYILRPIQSCLSVRQTFRYIALLFIRDYAFDIRKEMLAKIPPIVPPTNE